MGNELEDKKMVVNNGDNTGNTQRIVINDVPIEWDFEKGNVSFFGINSALFWLSPSLSYMFAPIVEEVGVDLFRLIVANSSRLGTQEDYESMVTHFSDNFPDGFLAWGDAVSLSGWGKIYLDAFEPERSHAVVRIKNPWELSLQADLSSDKQWGCPFLLGKVIGIFSRALGQNCWATDNFTYFDNGDSEVTLTLYASDKTIDHELSQLRAKKLTQQEKKLQEEIDAKTAELQTSNHILENIAKLDFLTNLNNRRSLEEQLQLIKENNTWSNHALMFIDLDQFKVINDTCGHLSGDRLLTIIGATLINITNTDKHKVYRYGGDEFTILISDSNTYTSMDLAHEIRKAISDIRYEWDKKTHQINCSIGLVSLAQIKPEVDSAIIAADNACYQAKLKGRNQVYIPKELDIQVENHLSEMNWVHKIREAITHDHFEMHFQVIKPLNGKKTFALEALIRMVGPDGQLIMPFHFLPSAENYGVIFDIDCWVINSVFKTLSQMKNNEQLQSIAINLSGYTLSNPKLETYLDQCFNLYAIDPKKICFELTETHMMMNLEHATAILSKLRKHGCTVSLDDFGAGMSSFGYLRKLPVDKIKIDGSFVKDMDKSTVDYTFVESITKVAKAMNIKTVAEFVETENIENLLTELNVDYGQGYFIDKPKPWNEIFTA